jgi:non-homologous end joining protein Ku
MTTATSENEKDRFHPWNRDIKTRASAAFSDSFTGKEVDEEDEVKDDEQVRTRTRTLIRVHDRVDSNRAPPRNSRRLPR